MSLWSSLLSGAAPASVIIAAGSFFYNEHIRRTAERRNNIQGLQIEPSDAWRQLITEAVHVDKTEITFRAYGPGRRLHPAFILWIEGHFVDVASPQLSYFDHSSSPVAISVLARRNGANQRSTIHVGLTWTEPIGKRFRQQYVRVNLSTHEIQEWHWKHFYEIRARRAESSKSGKPIGKWITRSGAPLPDWAGPTPEVGNPPQGTVEILE